MELILDIINIKDVQFSNKTAINDSVLSINRQMLKELLEKDKRLCRVDIELCHPGESCRILQVADVIEPRAKSGENLEDFPGALGRQGTAGEGHTCVLRNVSVVLNNQLDEKDLPESQDATGNIIDMSGPGAEFTPYANTHNVVVIPYPSDGTSLDDYKIALKIAGVKTAVYLAQAGRELEPDEKEIYTLPPLTEITRGMEHLPKIGYIFQAYCTSYPAMIGEPILYGDNIRELLPIIIHPNEIMDGAFINPYHGRGTETYVIQNHPIIKELYSRHGKDLCFVGMVLTVSRNTEPERERAVAIASNMASSMLNADGVILTKASSGAPDVDVAQTAQKCEDMDVKAVLIMFDGVSPADIAAGLDSGTVFNLPGAGSIVNTGNSFWQSIDLPAVDRIIGKPVILPSGVPSDGAFTKSLGWITGALDQEGHSTLVSVRY